MPLRNHFKPPVSKLASWEELHGAWPSVMAFHLNKILPPQYRSGVKIHLGSIVEVDVGTFEYDNSYLPNDTADGSAISWQPESPTLLLETEELTPPEYEVRVYDQSSGKRLVAAVEIVSPSNKDRPDHRDAFVSKCHAMLQQNVCVIIVDPVTQRGANLYAELADRLGASPPAIAETSIYVVSCRWLTSLETRRLQTWQHELQVGAPLPTLPLWLNEQQFVPLELELTYEETCKGLRIA